MCASRTQVKAEQSQAEKCRPPGCFSEVRPTKRKIEIRNSEL